MNEQTRMSEWAEKMAAQVFNAAEHAEIINSFKSLDVKTKLQVIAFFANIVRDYKVMNAAMQMLSAI